MNIMNFEKSLCEFEKAKDMIPGGIKGMHKIQSVNDYPAYYHRAEGSYVYDIDGNQYIDFVMGKGPYILGYGNERVNNAVIEQIKLGNIFPMGNTLHNNVADKILKVVPNAERVIFYKTGSCATSAAVRLARAYTEKKVVLSSGYHGWHDWCSFGKGILEEASEFFKDFSYDLDKFDEYVSYYEGNIAAVIITPEEYYFEESFYKYIENVCRENNIVFILDEVKSGFRVNVGGFQKKYNLRPDMSTFSKAISNGHSIAAVIGLHKILDINEEMHTTGTYDSEVISFAAANETLSIISEENVTAHIYEKGKYFINKLDELFVQYDISLYPVFAGGSFRIWSDNSIIENWFYKVMAKDGILLYAHDNSYISLSHTKDILDDVLARVEEQLKCSGRIGQGRKYEKFNLEYINKEFINKKGFLADYPGQSGRR